MGRHSSGRTNYSIAKELWIGSIIALLLAAALVAWFFMRDRASDDKVNVADCANGSISLPVAGNNEAAKALLDEFLATNPSVQDKCVKEYSDAEISKAALVISDASPAALKESVTSAGASQASSNSEGIATTKIAVAYPENAKEPEKDWSKLHGVLLPSDRPGVAATAAAALSNGDEKKAQELLDKARTLEEAVKSKAQLIAVPADEIPAGYKSVVPNSPAEISAVTRAVALNARGDVSEDQSRAAAEFAKFAASKGSAKVEGKAAEISTLAEQLKVPGKAGPKESAPSQSTAPAPAPASNQAAGTNTLVVLDSSADMDAAFGDKSAFDAARSTLLYPMRSAGKAGATVGLWNYSSPLNPGVTKGWRSNIQLGDDSQGENAATSIMRLGTGGQPQTHSAVLAAMATASDFAKESNKPMRVVLVTSGTSDSGDLAAQLKEYESADISLQVVHVGNGPEDKQLADWANAHKGSFTVAKDQAALNEAIKKAFGI